jgi:cardiolipin synthase
MPKKGILAWPWLLRLQFKTALRGSLRYVFGKRGQRRVQGMRLYYRAQALFVLRTGVSLRSITRDREVRLWIDGEDAFARLGYLIGRSRATIVVQMFIWKDDDTGRLVARWLLEAADRGVSVDIAKEAVGDFFESDKDFLGTKTSNDALWKAFWNHPNIRVSHDTNHDHAKVYVFDGQTVVLTGMNIADEYRFAWHDVAVEFHGTQFVEEFLARKPGAADDPIRIVTNTEERKEIRPMVVSLLRGAREHVVLEHAYVSDPDVVDELIELTKRGVALTVIIPRMVDLHQQANMQTVGRLITEAGRFSTRILLYPEPSHSKILLVDGNTAFLGSANLYKGSLDHMGEVNVLIRGRFRVLWRLREMLRQDILRSEAVSSPPQLRWLSRWAAWLGL